MLYSPVRLLLLIVALVTVTPACGFAAAPSAACTRPPLAARASCLAVVMQQPKAAWREEDGAVMVNNVRVTGDTLRSMVLADADGARVRSGSLLGAQDGRAVVVFLRHLGWPLCWDYALSWRDPSTTARLAAAGVAGPLFVSVGQPEQLRSFLGLNPELNGAPALIDDSEDFAAYRAAGFTNLLGDKQLDKPPDFKPPRTMSPGKWWSYLRNVAQLAPKPKGGSFKLGEVPTGVRVLGGTYALNGGAIVFSHEDEVPGATPEIEAVLKAVGA